MAIDWARGRRIGTEAVKLAFVLAVAQFMLPPQWKPINLATRTLHVGKQLETVSVNTALARVDASRGATISVLYLTILPTALKKELSDDLKRWQKVAAIHAFSIDARGDSYSVPSFARSLGAKVSPVWIKMPEGDRCALEQLAAVNAFAGISIDPNEEIPLLTLVLRDANGKVMRTQSVIVPNGGSFDPADLDGALEPFDYFIKRKLR
jgi:hypothetical protein